MNIDSEHFQAKRRPRRNIVFKPTEVNVFSIVAGMTYSIGVESIYDVVYLVGQSSVNITAVHRNFFFLPLFSSKNESYKTL